LFAGVGGSIASIAWHPDVNSAGASGAIFGILGALLAALLAAQLRGRHTFPRDILRPVGKWALLFLAWNVYAGFTVKGTDYAAHIGGLTTGFLMGLTATRPVTGQRFYTRNDLRRLLQTVPVAVAVLAVGLWWVQTAATSGDQLYWHTVRWLLAGERSVNGRFNDTLALVKAGKQNQRAFADQVERDVVPFWRQASARLSLITLSEDSPNLPALERLREISNGRARAFELLSEGLRKNDTREISTAEREMKRVDEIAKEPRTVP
jgi:rhomboid protease GluP